MKISKSRINTYKKCPRQYKYIYEDCLPSKPNQYMQLGLDVHKIAENVGLLLKDKENITKKDIIYAFEKGYVESEFDLSQHMTNLFDFFVNICIIQKYKIVDAEDDILNPQTNIRGIIDLVVEDPKTKELFVVDYKSGKAKSIKEYRLELCMYRHLVEYKYAGRTVSSAIIFFTKDGNYRGFNFAEQQSKGSFVTEEDYNAVFKYVDFIKNKINAKDFPPQKQYLCNYCEFQDKCMQDGGF